MLPAITIIHDNIISKQIPSQQIYTNLTPSKDEVCDKKDLTSDNYIAAQDFNTPDFSRRGSLLPILEHLHFNDEIRFSPGPPSLPTHLEASDTYISNCGVITGSNSSQILVKQMDNISGTSYQPTGLIDNTEILPIYQKSNVSPSFSNLNGGLSSEQK